MNDAALAARRMWTLFEPVHVISYFAAEAKDAFELAGPLARISAACTDELPFPNPVGVPAAAAS